MNVNNWVKAGFVLLAVLIAGLAGATWFMHQNVWPMSDPRFEVGEHKGARSCANCHQEIYDEWAGRSLHAVATTHYSFTDFLAVFKSNFLLNTIIGEDICYACHGSKTNSEGVGCETCHGTVLADASIEEAHEKGYKPRMNDLRSADFCAKCHELKSPLSGDWLMSLPSEWQKSKAAEQGMTCQGCHMPRGTSGMSYHGFDSALRHADIYQGDLEISDIDLDFPRLSLTIENRVTGHAIPASGGTRVLALDVLFLDSGDVEIHKIVQLFQKRFRLMPIAGVFPDKLVENSQLQGGESRRLTFTLPSELNSRIYSVEFILKFYSVSDEYQGDVKFAHWMSAPILRKRISLVK